MMNTMPAGQAPGDSDPARHGKSASALARPRKREKPRRPAGDPPCAAVGNPREELVRRHGWPGSEVDDDLPRRLEK